MQVLSYERRNLMNKERLNRNEKKINQTTGPFIRNDGISTRLSYSSSK